MDKLKIKLGLKLGKKDLFLAEEERGGLEYGPTVHFGDPYPYHHVN